MKRNLTYCNCPNPKIGLGPREFPEGHRWHNRKRCNHSDVGYICPVLKSMGKGHPHKDCVYWEYVVVSSGSYTLCNRPMDDTKRKRNTVPAFGAGDSECTWNDCPHYSKDNKQTTLTEFYDHSVNSSENLQSDTSTKMEVN